MKTTQIFEKGPGTAILLMCEAEHLDDMVRSIRSSVPENLKEKASQNMGTVLSLELTGEEEQNSFHDLLVLCSRLIVASGRRSHYEGLLLLNVSSLIAEKKNVDRLKALGEFLALKDGLASQCVTVLYGPTDENELVTAAECLDFDGKLSVARFEKDTQTADLKTLLDTAGMSCSTENAARLLQKTLDEMRDVKGFDFRCFFHSCAEWEGMITEKSIHASLNDPFSYVNRLKKKKALLAQAEKSSVRRIGFQMDN